MLIYRKNFYKANKKYLIRTISGYKKTEIRILNFIFMLNMNIEFYLNTNLSKKVIPKYI